ncbi:hypothetical protein CR162_16535 [Pseudoroseomonas rhizosphaerae]|uniref:DUF3800 domain-containing protein n=1 Tax=Teichococcus rhizosphaerae TaxID=1335062 RepID=A0A2C6XZE9_9PROT|nr:DUF3800 domain-containing protein [Pseudoroseomonas rhizosphaerae]PHK93892.1 hypothetical protein CR162_16535 [Pseudoroseomonas rhizosphaerae]
MTERTVVNLYCDESCHLEHDDSPVMVLGALACPAAAARPTSAAIHALKARHGLAPGFEIKWSKVSPGRLAFYLDLVGLFFATPELRFRAVVIPDKKSLDHAAFSQTHDDWYYKMYYQTLLPFLAADAEHRVYLDIKDTRGGAKTEKLHDVLCTALRDPFRSRVSRVQQVRSHEVAPMQLADLLIGAVGYANRQLRTSPAKLALVEALSAGGRPPGHPRSLSSTSYLSETKVNLLMWRPAVRSA